MLNVRFGWVKSCEWEASACACVLMCVAEFGHFIANGRIFYGGKRAQSTENLLIEKNIYAQLPFCTFIFIFVSHFLGRFNVVISNRKLNGFIAIEFLSNAHRKRSILFLDASNVKKNVLIWVNIINSHSDFNLSFRGKNCGHKSITSFSIFLLFQTQTFKFLSYMQQIWFHSFDFQTLFLW